MFAIASVVSLLLFLALGLLGVSKVFERIDPKYNDALVGFVVAAVGVYVLVAG